jgi:hypothetical protein
MICKEEGACAVWGVIRWPIAAVMQRPQFCVAMRRTISSSTIFFETRIFIVEKSSLRQFMGVCRAISASEPVFSALSFPSLSLQKCVKIYYFRSLPYHDRFPCECNTDKSRRYIIWASTRAQWPRAVLRETHWPWVVNHVTTSGMTTAHYFFKSGLLVIETSKSTPNPGLILLCFTL